MKININTNHLDNLIQKIKAKNSSWTPGEIRFEDIDLSEIRTIQGKEINLEDITSNDQGLIIFKGRPQMLYIEMFRCLKISLKMNRKAVRLEGSMSQETVRF